MTTVNPTDQGFFTANTHSNTARIGRSLDDSAILSMQRQYDNFDLFDRGIMANGGRDFSQLAALQQLAQMDNLDSDEDDIPYDDGEEYDYPVAIQERLKRANAQLENDQTSSASRNPPRVSFDHVVKAVDIVQDPQENEPTNPIVPSRPVPVPEEPVNSSSTENGTHEYTVPLNDLQPKQGPSLTEQIKAAQFYGIFPGNDRWATNANEIRNDREDDISTNSFKSNENHFDSQTTFDASSTSTTSKRAMIVAVNDRIEMQDEDDYIARNTSFTSNINGNDSFDANNRPQFLPTPPTEPKPQQQSVRGSFVVRPKSSTERKPQVGASNDQRPKSAGVSRSIERHQEKPSSGVDFKALLRQSAEKKRAEKKAEEEKKKEAAEKRKRELEIAEEKYKKWLADKNAVLRRINEEKQEEEKEKEKREAEEREKSAELREKKHKEWLERKRADIAIVEQFKQLRASEELDTLGEPGTWLQFDRIQNQQAFQRWLQRKRAETILIEQFKQVRAAEELQNLGEPGTWLQRDRIQNQRAYKRWLRKKHRQSLEEKRQVNTDAQRIRHIRHRSRGRYQCQEHEVKRPWDHS